MPQVLELTPSSSGWYFAPVWRHYWAEMKPMPEPLRPAATHSASPTVLGYDSDGRLRPVPVRLDVSFTA
jgi:hypothetical protein